MRAAGADYLARMIDDRTFATDGGSDPQLAALIDIVVAHTRCSDDFLAEAVRAGIRQVVILASGLDTRPYRLWWPRGTTVYEVERPETLDFKSEVLRGLGAGVTANRCAVGVDLGQDWVAALRRVGFDDTRATVWIAEQLLVGYLTPERQHRLLQSLSSASAAGSRFAADHLPAWNPLQLEAERAYVDCWQRHGLDVDLASLTHPGEYRYVPEYLTELGWETTARDATEIRGVLGLERPHHNPGDSLFIPKYVTAARLAARRPPRRC
ncbi:putative S-adenosyl-L-methionine-dependent methyltransferase [Mycobacterium parmense]|uniref:S-adenosyl-L-methionine-dependent methyltransferase n=1 Tax=Mycobacterium parmense TaxID=185642 RepID=A0A7I7YYS7_9MYCO|nr:putative S-adenosyl-L-methionine-dependent methyltransferase [Mycobacterium parmense]